MTPPPARVAWTLAVASLVFITVDTLIVAGSIGLFSTQSVGIHGWPLVDVAAGGCAVLGAVIVSADRRQPIGWLLNGIGMTTAVSMVSESYSRWVLFEGGPGPERTAELAGSLAALCGGSLALAGLAVTFLLVPDGRLLASGWRWVIADRRGRVHPVRERRPHRGAARHQHEGDGHRRGTPARRGVLRGRHPPRPGRCPGVGDVSRHPPAAVAGAGPATGADRGRRRRLGRPRPVRPPRQRGHPAADPSRAGRACSSTPPTRS